ncbi:MAG: serine/threonine protein kinase, partial [Thermoflexales bacterium]|nr:serine/threonine protein kinase [Thermoflexales bacterium]
MQGADLKEFGRFTGLVEIGRGGMSVVYRARSPEGELVALKLLAPHLVTSPSARARFEQEGALRLDHPNIVPVLEFGVEQGTPYLVMPYINGESLEQRVQRCGPLQPETFLPILEDIARALDYAHKHGVIHRDVKPSNVLIRAD